MATLITYKSCYGSSRQYAEWLGEKFNTKACDLKEISSEDLDNYDTIIHFGGLYAGGMSGVSFYRKNINEIKNKHFLLCAVGASPYSEKVVEEVTRLNSKNLPPETEFYYCEGNYDFPHMNFKHKTMMKMMNKMLLKEKQKNGHLPDWAEDYGDDFLAVIFSEFHHSDRKFLTPIINSVEK